MNSRRVVLLTFSIVVAAIAAFGLSQTLASARTLEARVLGVPSTPSGDRDSRPGPLTATGIVRAPTTIITGATPQALAEAMGIQPAEIVAASLNGSDPRAAGIGMNPLGTHFPTAGETFVILSTGLAESAEWPNAEEDLSYELYGLFNSQLNDLVQLDLQLRVPAGRNCANVDFAFYSEEYPEWVGSEFNDTFTAELGGTDLTISGTEVIAPLNFAFDTAGNIMSVNTVFGLEADTGTTYDGGTSLLRAQMPVVPGTVVEIVFSVQDLGDSILDSAVFLDKFFWSEDTSCGGGAQEDTDGDGLLDQWEEEGVRVTVDGVDVFVDLPAMGADPMRKDIFVEIDYMVAEPGCAPFFDVCFSGHSHMPKPRAMEKIIYSFFLAPASNPDGSTGINLHVDYGPHGIMNPETLELWGSRSQSNALRHDSQLGSVNLLGQYRWSEFREIKRDNFSKARAPFFHYAVFAHDLGDSGTTSGLSRGIGASDFIVSLGSWDNVVGSVNDQAGTFMHELGHNLGLRHSGRVDLLDTNFKPNYLSVMNYAFQTRGLRVGGRDGFFDYSQFELATLDEDGLDESAGLNAGAPLSNYGTRYWCSMNAERVVDSVEAIDWNCDGDTADTGIQENINEGPAWRHDTRTSNLRSYHDWANLVFTGGAIGQPGADPLLPEETEVTEITYEEDATLTAEFAVSVASSGELILPADSAAVYTFTVSNLGESTDAYTVTLDLALGWADPDSVPAYLKLAAGESEEIPVVVKLPEPLVAGSAETLVLTAQSQENPRVEDSWTVDVYVPSRVFLPLVLR